MISVQGWRATLAFGVLLTGCASPPQNAAHREQPTVAAPQGAPAASASHPAAASTATATAAPAGAAASSDPAPDSLSLVVDLSKRPVDEAENSGQICRQMLKPDTNSILTVCGTAAQWKKFKVAEAQQAEENLLRWQAGRF
jgi:hypothetical protein